MSLIVFQHSTRGTAGRFGMVLRDLGHRMRVVQPAAGDPMPTDFDDVHGVVALGGGMNVDQADQHPWLTAEMDYLRQAHEREIPVVGICLGAQLIATALGGEVGPMKAPEAGWAEVTAALPGAGTIDPVLAGLPWLMWQFHHHGYEVKKLPAGATLLASSRACPVQAYKVGQSTYAFQYHPEFMLDRIERVFRQSTIQPRKPEEIGPLLEQTQRTYPIYDHLSTRLSHNLATLLFSGHRAPRNPRDPQDPREN